MENGSRSVQNVMKFLLQYDSCVRPRRATPYVNVWYSYRYRCMRVVQEDDLLLTRGGTLRVNFPGVCCSLCTE